MYVQVSNKGLTEFSGLRSSAASLPFSRKGNDDLHSVIAFQTSAVSTVVAHVMFMHINVKTHAHILCFTDTVHSSYSDQHFFFKV